MYKLIKMNILFLDDELNLEYNKYNISIKISSDYNFIKINCSPKLSSDEIYEYILNKDEYNKIIFSDKKEKFDIKKYFNEFNKLFKDKKVIIKYNKKLYTMKIIFQLNKDNNISLNFAKKFEKSISNFDFKLNPVLKYQEKIFNKNYASGCNSIFDVYINYLDAKSYLITSNYENCVINIISLENNSIVATLKGHKIEILSVRYFFNEITKEELIISSDKEKTVIVWNIHDNFNIEFNCNIDYSQNCQIYSCIITNIQQFNYVITSCYNTESYYSQKNGQKDQTKMYSLMNKDFIKNVYNTETNCTRYMLDWYNENDEDIYIIELCDDLISINNLLKSKNYCILKSTINSEEYLTGFIYKNDETEYLITGSWNGCVRMWDLYEKEQIHYLDTNNCELYNIISWSNRYAIISYKFQNKIKIIDIKYFEITLQFESEQFSEIKCIKKIIHPIYGESLLTCSEKGDIKLFIIDEI